MLRALEESIDECGSAGSGEQNWYRNAASHNVGGTSDAGSLFGTPSNASLVAAKAQQSIDESSSSSWNVGGAVAASFQDLNPEIPKQAWETGIWSTIFGGGSSFDNAMFVAGDFKRPLQPEQPTLQESVADGKPAKVPRVLPQDVTFLNAISAKPARDWIVAREAEMDEAINEWTCFILTWPNCCEVTEQLSQLPTFEQQRNMIADVLGSKAPGTLRKRLRALKGYDKVLREYYGDAFPGDEQVLYDFLKHLQRQGKPHSHLKGLLEALNFTAFVIGVESLEPVVKSRRCRGAARGQKQTVRKPASALTVAELERLHDVALDDPDVWNRLFAGSCLMAVYCRARWSDLMHGFEVYLDMDESGNLAFIEISVGVHKTMNSSNFRNTVMPLVAPARGVKDGDWIGSWLACRQDLGIGDVPSYPVMPAPDHNKEPTVRPLETEEASKWMRYLLTGSMSQDPIRKLSSHSFKCTFLSFAAKFGVSAEERLVMGYHVTSSKMAHVYARDAAAPTILILEQIISCIRGGTFKPDSTRSGRFLGPRPEGSSPSAVMERVVKPELLPSFASEFSLVTGSGVVDLDAVTENGGASSGQPHAGCQDEGSSSHESTTSTKSSDTSCDECDRRLPREVPTAPPGYRLWQHRRSRVLHIAKEDYVRILACGRQIGPHHVREIGKISSETPKCTLCFKKDGVAWISNE